MNEFLLYLINIKYSVRIYFVFVRGIKVKIKNLKKSFKDRVILDDVSFECKSGESVAILGESGMGKSVMMRIIGMLLDADGGSIQFDGEEVVGISDRKREKIMKQVGFLFQYSGLFEHLTIWQNIMFYELYIQNKDQHDMKDVALQLMSELCIPSDAIDLKPSEVSGGMQRRVALARVIVKEPRLILLDEPTTGLDPVVCRTIDNLINETRRRTKATMITITHDLNSALQTSDRIVVLRYGRIVWHGATKDIFNAENDYIQGYIKIANISKNSDIA